MPNILTYNKTILESDDRPAMNHTFKSTDFTPDKNVNITGKIISIVYKFIFRYGGTSSPSWTGYASIISNDGTEYKGTDLTKTIYKNTDNEMSLTIPKDNCPPASVINSNDFSIKLTTTECSKNPYVPKESKMSIIITYGIQSYIYYNSEWKAATPYVFNGTAWIPATVNIYDNEWI